MHLALWKPEQRSTVRDILRHSIQSESASVYDPPQTTMSLPGTHLGVQHSGKTSDTLFKGCLLCPLSRVSRFAILSVAPPQLCFGFMAVDPIAVATLLNGIRTRAENVKVYRRRCENLADRCNLLSDALREDDGETSPSASHAEALNEAQATLEMVRTRIGRWAGLNTMRSLLSQDEIREGVDELQKKVDTCISACNVRIARQLAQAQRIHALDAQREIIAIRETMQGLLVAFTQYMKNPSTLPDDTTFRTVVREIQDEAQDIQAFDTGTIPEENSYLGSSQGDAFSDVMRRFCQSLVTLELNQPPDILVSTRPRRSNHHLSRRPTTNSSSRLTMASFVSRWRSGPPQLPLLDFGEEVTLLQTGPFISVVPSSPMLDGSSIYSEPMSMVSTAGPSTHGSQGSIFDHFTPRSSLVTTIAYGSLSPLETALTTRAGILKSTGQPSVITRATMEGLINYFLLKSSEEDETGHDTFFIAHLAFTAPLNVLGMLIRRFEEASMCPTEVCLDIQRRVMRLVKDWLRNDHVILADDDLAEMRRFIDAVNQLQSLDELVLEIVQGIHEKALMNLPPPPLTPSPAIGSPTPRQLAMALARLEEELYLRILPIEYTAHMGNLPVYCPNLSAVIDLHRRINHWVQSCILNMESRASPDGRTRRCENKRYFIWTAKQCKKICNFSSLGAIMAGLQSKAVDSLTVTHQDMLPAERQQYDRLVDFLKSDHNYRTYRKALPKPGSKGCIPWHVVDLHDINAIMWDRNLKDVDELHNPPLLNFEKWTRLKDQAMSILRYRNVPFVYEERGLESAMRYLKNGLQSVSVGEDFSRTLLADSAKLVKDENTLKGEKAEEIAGFRSRTIHM